MNGKEIWEETVRQMREYPEFQDAGVMYAQGEIDRLRAENERLRGALGGMLRSYFLVINDPLMERRDSLRAFILGVFSGDPQAATDALEIPPNAPDNRGA